jgi:hypothetical protein
VCAALLAIAWTAVPAAAADLATVRVGSATATWQPTVEYEAMTLTVSLPDGSSEALRFAAGEPIEFPLSLDGLYTWELVATPKLSSDTLAVLARARTTGDNAPVEKLREAGVLPADMTQAGTFDVAGGVAVNADAIEASDAPASLKDAVTDQDEPGRSQTIPTDLIVQGSECVGFDCVSSESFGADTIRLKENNLRIHFDDTSSSGSFPNNDWRIVANDQANGGASYLAIEDSTAGRQVFRVTAGARSNSIFVDSGGRVGLGTSTPSVELHIADGDSPALRLEQNGSSGFTPQTWDIAGNETNFFVRDVTNGSKLPFKIKPSAPTNSLYVNTDGNIGIGTASPGFVMHGKRSGSNVAFVAERSDGATTFMNSTATFGQFGTTSAHPLRLLVDTDIKMTLNADDSLSMKSGATCSVGGSWVDASSRDLKQDINHLSSPDAAAALKSLVPVRFRYKADATDEKVGFIAEDVPDLVATNDRKGLSSLDIVAVLTKVVQDQQSTIDELRQRLVAVEDRVEK